MWRVLPLLLAVVLLLPVATLAQTGQVGRAVCGAEDLLCQTVLRFENRRVPDPVPTAPEAAAHSVRLTYEYEATGGFLADEPTEVRLRFVADDTPLVVEPVEMVVHVPIEAAPGDTGTRSWSTEVAFTVTCRADDDAAADGDEQPPMRQGEPKVPQWILRIDGEAMPNAGHDGSTTAYSLPFVCLQHVPPDPASACDGAGNAAVPKQGSGSPLTTSAQPSGSPDAHSRSLQGVAATLVGPLALVGVGVLAGAAGMGMAVRTRGKR